MQRATSIFLMAAVISTIFIITGSEAKRMTMKQLRGAMKPLGKGCAAHIKNTPEPVAKTKDGIFEEDQGLQCWMHCMLNYLKFVIDGKPNLESMDRQIDLMVPTEYIERFKATIRSCLTAITSEDPCVLSWQYLKCTWETDSEIYIFPYAI